MRVWLGIPVLLLAWIFHLYQNHKEWLCGLQVRQRIKLWSILVIIVNEDLKNNSNCKMKFDKLRIINDWHYLTYYEGDRKLDEKRGGHLQVAWPDNTIEQIEFVSKEISVTYGDHGHDGHVYQFQWLAKINYHGHDLLIPIQELAVSEVQQQSETD